MISTASALRADGGSTAPVQFRCGCGICADASVDWLAPVALVPSTTAISPTDDGDGSVTVGGSYQGAVNTEGDTDIISVVLQAGETYMISLRGTGPEALLDPFLQVSDPNNAPLGTDDDGGTYINSLMTITATVAGTYKITAGALPATGGVGTYTVDVRQMGEDVIDDNFQTNDTLAMNANTFGFIEEYGEFDVYKVTLNSGSLYTFEVAGGADYNTNYLAVPPGELDTKLTLFDANGNEVAFNDDISFSAVPGEGDISSKIGYMPTASGTYFLRVEAYESNAGGGVGGYALTAQQDVITNLDPLDAIDWKENLGERQNKWPTNEIKVYFAQATDPTIYSNPLDGEPPEKSLGWTDYEIEQAMEALRSFSDYANLTFTQVDTAEEATFKLVTVTSESYLGRMYPPNSSEHEGTGFFAINWPSWDRGTPTGQPITGALEQGADGWFTLIHEFGHGLGLAHPHDNGGNSEIMAGVVSPFDSFGVFDLNQGVYTTMSYNPGWHTHPDYADFGGTTYGMNGTAGALDIGVLQAKYGVNPTQGAGNTTYVLPDENAEGTFYKLIWDLNGVDTIAHNGSGSARIDLTAATLDYSPTGGGVVSFVDGIYGGFTIAKGVVIENAFGGRDGDILIGNAANNFLDGGGGLDKMIGGTGNDTYGVNSTRDLITENEGGGTDRVRSSVNYTLGQHLENLVLIGTAISGTGNALVNDIIGNSKDNVLDGKGGADTMRGGGGNDTYFVDNVGDQVIELSDGGTDLVWSTVTFTLADNVNHLTLLGSSAIDGHGNVQANILTGNAAANLLNGRGDADTMRGGKGDDIYVVDNVGDQAIEIGGGGDDLVQSSVTYRLGDGLNDLTLTGSNAISGTGNSLSNQITGNGAANYLNGVGGNDVLNGGLGNDRLNGGTGLDRFLFDTPLDAASNVDAILDFSVADDTIYLDRTIFTGIADNGVLSAAAFRVGASAADASDRIVFDTSTQRIYYDVDGLGGAAQVLFATVSGGVVLTNADFVAVI
ncbi:MAG TPA: pre-peptidase C-terminal domain-containing protein [Allosphingosinicella sp.]|nr:pre-peptidase C-terminal domain-containing protein [Allosphingosinicella sp.]